MRSVLLLRPKFPTSGIRAGHVWFIGWLKILIEKYSCWFSFSDSSFGINPSYYVLFYLGVYFCLIRCRNHSLFIFLYMRWSDDPVTIVAIVQYAFAVYIMDPYAMQLW